MMNKDTAFAFESLGLASTNLTNMMQSIRYAPEPEFLDAYMRAQKAIDEMAIFLTANIGNEQIDPIFRIEVDEDD